MLPDKPHRESEDWSTKRMLEALQQKTEEGPLEMKGGRPKVNFQSEKELVRTHPRMQDLGQAEPLIVENLIRKRSKVAKPGTRPIVKDGKVCHGKRKTQSRTGKMVKINLTAKWVAAASQLATMKQRRTSIRNQSTMSLWNVSR